MSTELTAYRAIGADPTSALAFIDQLGKAFHQGGLAGCKSEGQGKAMALTCLCDQITPLQFMRTYHLMDGAPSMRADAMLAAFMADGGKWKWLEQGDDGKLASAQATYGANDLTVAYSIEDAKRAELVKPKGNWVKDPGSMLRARCVSKGIRMVAPHILAGVYLPEELAAIRDENYIDGEVVSKPKTSKAAAPKNAAPAATNGQSQPVHLPPRAVATPEERAEMDAAAKAKPVKGELVTDTDPATAAKSQTEQLVAEAGAAGAVEFINSDLRNEIQHVQSQFELTPLAVEKISGYGCDHINKLTLQQARRLLVDLYVQGLGFTEKRDAILASKSLSSLDDASEELIQQMLDSLRAKYEGMGTSPS